MKPFKFHPKQVVKHSTFQFNKMFIKDCYINAGLHAGKREYMLMDCVTLIEAMYCAEYLESCWILAEAV